MNSHRKINRGSGPKGEKGRHPREVCKPNLKAGQEHLARKLSLKEHLVNGHRETSEVAAPVNLLHLRGLAKAVVGRARRVQRAARRGPNVCQEHAQPRGRSVWQQSASVLHP